MFAGAIFLICIGFGACSGVTDESCSVALGDNVELPAHASHVLAMADGVQALGSLDDMVVNMINREAARIGEPPPLTSEYIHDFNTICAIPSGKPGV